MIVEENKIFQSFKKFFFILRFSNDSRKIFFLLNLKDTIFDIYIYHREISWKIVIMEKKKTFNLLKNFFFYLTIF